jgi:hypothetical protein
MDDSEIPADLDSTGEALADEQERALKRLAIDMEELAYAMEDDSWMFSHYLDTETGQVLTIDSATQDELEALYEEAYKEDEASLPDLALLLADHEVPEWKRELLLDADRVEEGYGDRYIHVPEGSSHDGYRDMQRFIATVEDGNIQDRLWRAIEGRGAFRRFKNLMDAYPRERERWFAFKKRSEEKRAVWWLQSVGIDPIPIERPPVEKKPPEPPIRSRLLAEALWFVEQARDLEGVTRIALIGSLTTDKPDPKDVDMLVTVTDEMDLEPLATLGRKLSGHCQSMGYGGEVFLANPKGQYLGRTCPWRQCGPGIRMSCYAQHCGRRHYLYDDLQVIRLRKGLIAAPPIDLWPEVVARVPVPEDVEAVLLLPLRKRSLSSATGA